MSVPTNFLVHLSWDKMNISLDWDIVAGLHRNLVT